MNTWDNIHPAIQQASRPIAEASKYDDAIFAALRYIEGEIQERIGSKSIGQSLLNEAFDTNSPRINISDDARDREGIKEIFSGALSNIRNDRGHKKTPFLPCKTLEGCILYLSFASFLLYLLDKDKHTFPQIQAVRILGSYDQPRIELRGLNFRKDVRVLAERDEISIVRTSETLIEALLPSRFNGTVKIVLGDTESNEVYCDAASLKQEVDNFYETIAAEIPLYEDCNCTLLRTGVTGLLLRATEGGGEFLRIVPTYPNKYKAGFYVTHGPFQNQVVGETWYRDPNTGEIHYAWTSSSITIPDVISQAGGPKLVGISILPSRIKTQIDERHTLSILGHFRDGNIRKEIDITDRVAWRSIDPSIVFVNKAIVYPKKLGRSRIECELEGFAASSDISIEHFPKGERAVYFQGLRRLQQIKFDSEDNLYICNQSASIYQILRAGGFREVVRVSLPDTAPYGIDCIALDSKRNLFATDVAKRMCLRFPWTGQRYSNPDTLATVVSGTKKGIVVDSTGHIFVAVMGPGIHEGSIIHIEPNGRESFFQTRDTPIYLALDSGGNIVTPSTSERAIHIYSRNGELINIIPHGVEDSVSDILIDPSGAIYLPFFYSGQLFRITIEQSGPKLEKVAEGFPTPGGIAMDSQGRIYISNFGGNTIELIY